MSGSGCESRRAAQAATLGTPVTVTAKINDPGSADTHTASVVWSAGGATEVAAVDGNTVRASHVYTEVGIYAVTLCARDDDGGQGCAVVELFVEDDPTGVGNPPTLSTPGDQQSIIGESVVLSIFAEDADGDLLSFSAEGLPAGLSIDSESGVISGTPTSAGNYQVTVSVTDGKENVSISFLWRVLSTVDGYKQYLPAISKF